MTFLPDTVRWYLTLMAATWAMAPVARLVARRFPDHGAFIARPAALLCLVWPTWFLAAVSPIPYTTTGLWITVILGGIAGWAVAYRRQVITIEWLRWLAIAEIVSLAIFLRVPRLPRLHARGDRDQKPMDSAFLASARRTTDIPPANPWLSGEPINHYYVGYLIHGSLARMSGVPSWSPSTSHSRPRSRW